MSLLQERNLKFNKFPPLLWDEANIDSNNNNEYKQKSSAFSFKNEKKFFFNMNNIILKEEEDSSKDNQNKEKQNNTLEIEKANIIKDDNMQINKDNIDINKNLNKEDINKELNKKDERKNVLITKFFTDNNTGLKCSCFKTQCDKYYCECFRSGRYCIKCNCKNCLNQPPKYSTTDIKEKNNTTLINKEKKIFCTCTKSGCKLKYCECFKLGLECSDSCRCVKCENQKIKKYNLYKISSANSIYIVNNEIFQDINGNNNNKKFIKKKRKKRENKINKNKEDIKNKEIKSKKITNKIDNGSLFDENGKMIFTHASLSNFDNY